MSGDRLPQTAAQLREYLPQIAQESYREFSSKLVPGVENMLGVRLPKLRMLAKSLAKGDFRQFLAQAKNTSFEETAIKGMVIGYARMELEERLHYVENFVPEISNWSICDSFCAGLTAFRKDPERVWRFLQPYLESKQEYEARFAAVVLLDHFKDSAYLPQILEGFSRCPARGYYARMGIAWAISVYFAAFPQPVEDFLESGALDPETLQKTRRKILESTRVSASVKEQLRSRWSAQEANCLTKILHIQR